MGKHLFEEDVDVDVYRLIQAVGSVGKLYELLIAKEDLKRRAEDLRTYAESQAPTEIPPVSGVYEAEEDESFFAPSVFVDVSEAEGVRSRTLRVNWNAETVEPGRKAAGEK